MLLGLALALSAGPSLESARASGTAGIRVVTIPNSLTENLDISAADFRIKSIMELPDLIEKINHD